MATIRFDNALTAVSPSLLSAPLKMNSYAATFSQGRTMSPETEWPEESVAVSRGLARGVRWALTIEGAAGLCVYAIWHLLRLWL